MLGRRLCKGLLLGSLHWQLAIRNLMPVSGIAMKPSSRARMTRSAASSSIMSMNETGSRRTTTSAAGAGAAPTPSQAEVESVVGRQLKAALLSGADASYAVGARRFFKLAYCPDDVFIGLKVPVCRAIVREHLSRADAGVIGELVMDNRHEMRMAGFMCLVESYIAPSKSSWAHHEDEDAARQSIVTEYLSSLKYCDNWDLVDVSCSKILGDWLVRQHRADIEAISTAASAAPGGTNNTGLSAEAIISLPDWYQALLRSGDFWEVRVSVVLLLGAVLKCNTTFAFLVCKWHLDRLQQADLVLAIKGVPFADRDLVHKALGWVLREAGKLDRPQLVSFLNQHTAQCHRTTMRYATEHFDRAAAKRLVALAQPTSAAAAATAAVRAAPQSTKPAAVRAAKRKRQV
eukprot:TRINITY_DN3637_c0_g1_i1.p1 TRINITY_DN3637_c0_g1~~TRINITY_DN3637_c0_g1_i1.p1  ORF type:complete len:414 (-),score=103.57 TRINITY_DN3637_c0_g1_i1:283-1491(-)